MLQGPQPSKRTRKKPINTRTRATTDYQEQQPSNTRSRARTDYQQQKQNAQPQQKPQQAQDDLLDLFGSFATNSNNNAAQNNSSNNNNNNNSNDSNPFDAFGDFGSFGVNGGGNANNSMMNGHNNNNSGQSNNHGQSNQDDTKTTAKAPKKKKKKKEKKKKEVTRVRAATVQTKPAYNNNNNNNNNTKNGTVNPPKSTVKMKKIDVLPLLHKGIRANKFKLNGNKSKVRTFYLTDSNFYFCWEAVGAQNDKKGLFGKGKTTDKRAKIDKDRSIPIRAIRTLQKNPAYMMQSYNFIPPQQKALTLSIVYTVNGTDKKLNFMSYEPFHHQLFFEGMNELISAARDPKRNLSEVFELYVDFPKEILPKHLRPQRFKWEPLGDNDFNQQNDTNKDDDSNNLYFDTTDQNFRNVDVYDPTQAYGRERVKSF